jgi:cytochrome oxidase Cu insertion factor (SCO1/SenC/PrrC family)
MAARRRRTRPRDKPDRRRRPPVGWLLGAVLLVAVLVGGVLWLAGQGSTGTGSSGLADQPAPGATLALPSTAGPPVTLASLRGKQVVLYFYEGST